MTPLPPRVTAACERLGLPDTVRAMIAARHGEPHRHYHTLRHIEIMLGAIPEGHRFSGEMMAAALFHDIVYEPARSDNEAQSAALFEVCAAGMPGVDAALVSTMILATRSHHFRADDTTADAAINLLLKADLGILWHPDPAVYAWYARAVRAEYGFVPEDRYREARKRILAGLRDDILGSGQLEQGEAAVLVRNVAGELRRLQGGDAATD